MEVPWAAPVGGAAKVGEGEEEEEVQREVVAVVAVDHSVASSAMAAVGSLVAWVVASAAV